MTKQYNNEYLVIKHMLKEGHAFYGESLVKKPL